MKIYIKIFYTLLTTLMLLIIPSGSAMRVDTGYQKNIFNLNQKDYEFIDSVLTGMTIEEKCAQMIMPNANGVDTNELSGSFLRLKKFIQEYKVGGLIFFRGNGARQKIITDKLQSLSKLPLLIASDFERGPGMRLEDETEFPYNMAFAATGEPLLSYYSGRITALRGRMLGVHQNYAPLLDINRDPNNPVINIRAYSDSPEIASKFGSYFIK